MFASVLLKNEEALAWTEEEKGGFKEEYVPPVKIPVVDHKPWQDRNIRLPIRTREKVIEFLKRKVETGLYERSQSSYRSGFFAVEKKDGRIRLVHDLQKLNSITVRDAGVPPNMDEMTEELAGCYMYTGLDAFSGYDQAALHKESRDLTTFESPMGTLRLRRLPQGWTNAVAAFQRIMSFIYTEELHDTLKVYIDDVVVCGPRVQTPEDPKERDMVAPGIRRFVFRHAQFLNVVLHKMKKYGGTFSGGKLQIGVEEIEVVGYLCSANGRRLTKEAIAKVLKWPACKNPSEVRGFLGTVGIARGWIHKYGEMSRPLVVLTTLTPKEFVWEDKHDESMTQVKKAVANSGCIRPINYAVLDEFPILVAIDSSWRGCGVALSQMGPDGKRYYARFLSFYFNEVQQRYSQPKLELYGVYVGLRALRYYIHGTRFILEVDCTSVKQMINNPVLPTAAESRWCWYIKMHDFEMRHVPGVHHRVPDGLSRRPPAEDDSDNDTDPEEWLDEKESLDQLAVEAHAVGVRRRDRLSDGLANSQSQRPEQLFDENLYEEGSRWRQVGLFLDKRMEDGEEGPMKPEAVRQLAAQCFLRNKRVFRRHAGRMPRMVLGKRNDVEKILENLHELRGHRGKNALFAAVADRFFWDGMMKDIEHWVRTCPQCQARDQRFYKDPRRPVTVPTIFAKVTIDCFRMPQANPEGKQTVVVARDDLTGWAEAEALVSPTASAIASWFFKSVITRFGLVGYVTSDNGREFMGMFRQQLVRYQIPHITTNAYNPAANGANERGHAALKEAMFKVSVMDGLDWEDWLPYALWADRTTVRRSTGYSPYYLMYGQHSVFPIDFEMDTFLLQGWEEVTETGELLALRAIQLWNIGNDRTVARHGLQDTRDSSVFNHNRVNAQRHRDRNFREGDLVLVRNSVQDNSMAVKKDPRFRGPYRIAKVSPMGSVDLKELDGTAILDPGLRHVGHNRIRRFQSRSDPDRLRTREDRERAGLIHYRAPHGNENGQIRLDREANGEGASGSDHPRQEDSSSLPTDE